MGTSTVASLTAVISANNTKFKKGIKQSNSVLGNFKKAVGTLGPAIGAAFGVRAIKNFVKSSLDAYDIQVKEEQKLLTALKGRRDVQQRLIQQAQLLQKSTLFGDEETIKAQALLATMGLTEAEITKLTPLVQDMATALDMDLAGAASLVGKTVATSTDALKRYFETGLDGVSGSTERAIVLTETLTNRMGGQAEAAAKAGTGPLNQFKMILGDISEQVGAIIVEGTKLNQVFINLNKILSELDLVKFAADFKKWKEENQETYDLVKAWLDPIGAYNKLIGKGTIEVIKGIKARRDANKAETEWFVGISKTGEVITSTTEKLTEQTKTIDEGSLALDKYLIGLKGLAELDLKGINKIDLLNAELHNTFKDFSIEGFISSIKFAKPEIESFTGDLYALGMSLDEVEGQVDEFELEKLLDEFEEGVQASKRFDEILTNTFINIGSSFAESLGRVAAGTKTLQDTLNELSAMIVSALGDIAIAAGIQLGVATPQGLGLIVGGLALKGIGAFKSSNQDNGDHGMTFERSASSSDSQELYIRGNNLVTAYNQTSELNNRLY